MTNALAPSQDSPAATAAQTMHLAASSTSPQPLPTAWVERVFERLSAFYGSKFADLWSGCDIPGVKAVWDHELAGHTSEELARGIAACRTRDWPPTLPEFLKLCRPALDYERAFLEAVEQMRRREIGDDRWSSAAVFWAAGKLGSDIHAHPYNALKARWQKALDEAVEDIKAGRSPSEVPQRRASLPPPGQCSVSREEARRRIAAARDLLAHKLTLQ